MKQPWYAEFGPLFVLGMVHWGMPYPRQALALLMLFPSIFLLLHGPGRLAVGGLVRRRG